MWCAGFVFMAKRSGIWASERNEVCSMYESPCCIVLCCLSLVLKIQSQQYPNLAAILSCSISSFFRLSPKPPKEMSENLRTRPRFHYWPLDPARNEIRLLRLLPPLDNGIPKELQPLSCMYLWMISPPTRLCRTCLALPSRLLSLESMDRCSKSQRI